MSEAEAQDPIGSCASASDRHPVGGEMQGIAAGSILAALGVTMLASTSPRGPAS